MNKSERRGKRADSAEGVEKVTISITAAHLEAMRRFAKREHGGNLSGAFAELVAEKSRLDAMDALLAQLPPATAEEMAQVRAEREAPLPPPPRLRRPKRTAKKVA